MFLLSGENITCGYGSVDIVSNCNIGVKKGEISSIVGPNGAGKSTAMKALFGLLPLKNGRILLNGEDITNLKPQQRVLKGMGFVPQTNNIFPSLTVQENLEMGAFIDKNNLNEMLKYVYDLFNNKLLIFYKFFFAENLVKEKFRVSIIILNLLR